MTLRGRNVLDPSSAPTPTPARPERLRRPVPWVAGGVVALSVLAFLVDWLVTTPEGGHIPMRLGELFGPKVTAGQWWRVLTMVFIHGSPDSVPMSVMHIGFNMWVVVTLGFVLERGIGSGRMLLISLITAIGASAFALHFSYDVQTVGASGMILGWAGAMLPIVHEEHRRSIGLWLVQIAIISLVGREVISWAGHLGGFLFGLPCGLALRTGRRFWLIAPLVLAAAIALAYAAGTHPPAGTQSLWFHA